MHINNTKLFKLALVLYFLSTSFRQAYGQSTALSTWNWATLSLLPQVHPVEMRWLRDSLSIPEQQEVLRLVSALSQPAACQLLPAFFHLDGSAGNPFIKRYSDSLAQRPPDGPAGVVRVAYLTTILRRKLLREKAKNTAYTSRFTGQSLIIDPYQAAPNNLELHLDFAPAQTLLDILATPDINAAAIRARLRTHAFAMLIQHHNQSFYSNPLTQEQLILCLEKAASTEPLAQLYRYTNPFGLLNYVDVTANLTSYHQVLHTLRDNEFKLLEEVKVKILPYLPAGTKMKQTISFFFISGADGWTADDIAALDLNYFKDNYIHLRTVLQHETFHAAQRAVSSRQHFSFADKRQEVLTHIVDDLFSEGTATFVAAPAAKTVAEKQAAVSQGAALLEQVYQATLFPDNLKEVQRLADKGIAGAGAFYWLGAEMSRIIVQELGAKQLANVIPLGGVAFCQCYLRAAAKASMGSGLISPAFAKYIASM